MMFRNYFHIAWRNIKRSRFFSALNIAGLAFGMTVCLFILCWVADEYGVDKYHTKGEQIYRLHVNADWGGVRTLTGTPVVLGEEIKNTFPEITANAQLWPYPAKVLFKTGEKTGIERSGAYVSPNFLETFDFPLTAGDKHTALSQPNAIVLTTATAKRYFGSSDPIGKIIHLDNGRSLQVTGVAADVPASSSIQFSYLLPMSIAVEENSWLLKPGSYSVNNYMVVKPGTDIGALTRKIQQNYRRINPGTKNEIWLQPFEDTYLYGRYDNGKVSGGRIEYVRLFFITALVILAIACINFMNLSTARASGRAKEVGVRKSMGATRLSLILQFTGEAILMCALAALLAGAVAWLLLPVFNNFTGKHIAFTLPAAGKYLLLLLGVTLVTGLLAGSYPAFVLSRFLPVKVLKGNTGSGGGAFVFRKGLVVVQFVLSFIFIAGSVVIYGQMKYIYHRNLGIDRENIMYVELDDNFPGRQDAIEQLLAQLPAVKAFTYSNFLPLTIGGTSADLSWEGKPEKLAVNTAPLVAGYDYAATMGITMKEGRDFSRSFPTDSGAYIINETAARVMGMQHPLGKEIGFWNGKGKIIGVMKDFHFTSMHENISPLVIMLAPRQNNYMMLRLEKGDVGAAVAAVEKVFRKWHSGYPFEYHFLDETFDNMYRSETMLKELAGMFAGIAVLISCMGLFGLSVFTAEERKKEISIRKILGASVLNVTTLLSRDFLQLVVAGILLATPVSWYLMHSWLSGFAYHVPLSPWIFIAAALLAIVIAAATVSFQSVKAALANPVQALKSE
jgi:ABC-type antimicrobial peptide transport system permease subunit